MWLNFIGSIEHRENAASSNSKHEEKMVTILLANFKEVFMPISHKSLASTIGFCATQLACLVSTGAQNGI